VFLGLPMSTSDTGAAQQARLHALGFDVTMLPSMVDLDSVTDLPAVTASGSAIRTAALARKLGMAIVPSPAHAR